MSKEAMKQEPCCHAGIAHDCHAGPGCRIAERLKASPPAQQEPVAMWDGKYQIEFGNLSAYKHGEHSWIPLYTSPPAQRTWVGLSDEESTVIWANSQSVDEALRATEKPLMENNI